MKKLIILLVVAMLATAVNFVAEPNTALSAQSPGLELEGLVRSSDRDGIRSWAANKTLPELNEALVYINKSEKMKDNLCNVLLKTKSSGADRKELQDVLKEILSNPVLGIYIEIFSYTEINLEGDGFYYSGAGKVQLTRNGFLSSDSRTSLIMHECFHSFNDHNGGPAGALNEGSAIWIYKKAFNKYGPGENWAEATYGTKSYYRDMWNPSQPYYELSAPSKFTQRLVDVYGWLSIGDESKLPWWDNKLLNNMYDKYFRSIDRNVDFYHVWLPAMKAATFRMVNDPQITDPNRVPMPSKGAVSTALFVTRFVVGQASYSVNQGGSVTGTVYNMDAYPYILDGRTFVPVRYLGNSLGAQTEWDANTQKVTVIRGGTTVVLTIGSNIMVVNGTPQQMDIAPMIRNGRTYLPGRHVAEALSCKVDWDQNKQAVTVTYPAT